MTSKGIQTSAGHDDLDVIGYATGFDALTGGFDKTHIEGVGGQTLRDKWADGPNTCLGIMTHGFPNLLLAAGPQSASGSSNFPRGYNSNVADGYG